MKRAVRVTIHALLMASRQQPACSEWLLCQALRLAQQALSQRADDRDAIRCLGMVWWRLGAKQRGRDLLTLHGSG